MGDSYYPVNYLALRQLCDHKHLLVLQYFRYYVHGLMSSKSRNFFEIIIYPDFCLIYTIHSFQLIFLILIFTIRGNMYYYCYGLIILKV